MKKLQTKSDHVNDTYMKRIIRNFYYTIIKSYKREGEYWKVKHLEERIRKLEEGLVIDKL